MSEQTTIAGTETAAPTEGGSTAGLREAALAKRGGAKPAGNTTSPPSAKPTPAATALGDVDARAAKKKLPSRAANDNASEDAEIAALANDDSAAASTGETIRIGEHDIPIALLEQLPDEALKKIKRKLRAGGEDVEITIFDALNDVPKARDYMNKTRKLAAQRKELEQIARRMGGDTVGAYMALHGVTRGEAVDALSKQLLGEFEREQMTPDQRAAAERQAQLEEKAARAEAYERAEKERQDQAQQAKYREQHLANMRPALEAAGLPVNHLTIARVAMALDAAMREGVISTASPDEMRWAAGEVAKELAGERDAWLPEDADGDALIAKIGEKRARQIARAYAKRVQRQAAPATRPTQAGAKPAGAPQQAETWNEWRARANREAAARDKARGLR